MPQDDENESLPDDTRGRRLVGFTASGQYVNNVTPDNAHDVYGNRPTVAVHLYDHEESLLEHIVQIPNTREKPDVVKFDGKIYHVVSAFDPPYIYAESMVLEAELTLIEDEEHDNEPD